MDVNNSTPQDYWSGIKPYVKNFCVFGCLAFVHILDSQRKKLDDKSRKCVYLWVSQESKAYKLLDPILNIIITSICVVFDE